MNSKGLGIKTVIKDYTNAKGVTKPAHFTQNNKYYGSTHALGKEPVFYDGKFLINREQFAVVYPKLEEVRTLSDFFVPKPVEPGAVDEDDIPLAQLRKK